jgi:glycosyltransferase involved in cell wall biosynthesis
LQNSFDVEAYWCGDGPLRGETERLVNEMGLESRVRIIGFRADLPAWMRCAACFVMTSDHEGSPNVIAEAMAIGVPVVSTNCDHGPAELLADERGWLAPVGDAEKIAEAVAEALSNPEEAQRRVCKAQRWVQENLDLTSIGERWKKLIDHACQPQAPQGESTAGRIV